MGAPDSALPVFSFPADWGPGITEHIEWLTDTLTSKTNAEQRLSMRQAPRRSFEVQITPLDQERTFLDLFVRRFSSQEFMVPLWHDHATLSAAAASAATSLSLDTTNREFVNSGMALLVGSSVFNCEAVQIGTVSAGSMTLSAPTVNAWPAGATIHPLRRSWLLAQPKPTHETDRLDTIPMQFLLSGPEDYDGGSEELATYGGYPILSPAPDWSNTLSLEFARVLAEVDGKTGLRTIGDPAGRSFAIQMHRWFLNGRVEQAAFRRLIARLRGKQGALWLPSFTSDLIVVAAAASTATHIDVKQCGLVYTGLVGGRTHAITAAGEMLAFTGVTAPSTGVERLALAAPLSGALAVGDALSFADVGRIDSDTIDIHHQTDSDGVAQVELPFRTFPDVRDGSGASALALETASMTDTGCGGPCAIPTTTTAWPLTITGTVFSPGPIYSIVGEEVELTASVNFYKDLCNFYSCYFVVNPSGPQISFYDETGVHHCLTGTNCGSSTETVVTFDSTYDIVIASFTFSLRAYFDGANIGIELTNPHSAPLEIITVPSPRVDYTLPIFGSPAQTDVTILSKWGVQLTQLGANGSNGWDSTSAIAHDYNLQIQANGVDIGKPFQRIGHPNTTYEAAYQVQSHAVFGFTGSPFADCIGTNEEPVFGGPCT